MQRSYAFRDPQAAWRGGSIYRKEMSRQLTAGDGGEEGMPNPWPVTNTNRKLTSNRST